MNLHKLKIGIDVDDVLFSCNQYAIDLANAEHHYQPPLSIHEITQWEPCGERIDQRLEYFHKEEFFRDQPVLPGAKEFIHELSLRNVEIFIITAIAPEFSGIRAKRIQEEFPEIKKENILLTTRKDLIQVDVLFDDNSNNCINSPSTYPVLKRYPWNHKMTGCLSVNRYEEFLALVDMILEPKRKETYETHKFYVFVGPSASGKTAIIKRMEKEGLIKPLVPYTTRSPRVDEKDGVNYHFVTREEFLEDMDSFFETTTYAGNYYGSKLHDIVDGLKHQHMAAALDICGAIAVKNAFKEQAVLIYVDRPKEDLVLSILKRNVSDEEKMQRILSISDESKNANLCDMILKNHGSMDETIRQLKKNLL